MFKTAVREFLSTSDSSMSFGFATCLPSSKRHAGVQIFIVIQTLLVLNI